MNYRKHPMGEAELGWWAGYNEEWFNFGPEATREDAIAAAVEDCGCEQEVDDGVWEHHICITRDANYRCNLAMKFDADDWLERVGDGMEDEEGPDENGDRHPLEEIGDEDRAALEECVRSAIWHWQQRRGLVLKGPWFTGRGGPTEQVVVPFEGADA